MTTTWRKTWKPSRVYPSLDEDIETDVLIVGGGITGITAAYLLARAGERVVVVDKNTLSQSTTAYTTAMITYELDTPLEELMHFFGEDKAFLTWKAGREALDNIDEIIKKEKIDCEFLRVPEFVYANTEKEWGEIRKDADLGKNLGFDVEIDPSVSSLPFPNFGHALYRNQAKFHPLKYCEGLRNKAEELGALFFENTAVEEIMGGDYKEVIAETALAKIRATWVIVATYAPFNKPRELFAKKGMYRTYMMEISIPSDTLPEALYLDAANPYHYFRIDKNPTGSRMIMGGEDHRKEIPVDPEKNFVALENYARKILRGSDFEIVERWRGGILETIDGLPYIGPYSREFPNRLVATGFSGNGMTYSTVAGTLLRDYILGQDNKYRSVFSPLRHYSWRAFKSKFYDYSEEFVNGALRNFFQTKKNF